MRPATGLPASAEAARSPAITAVTRQWRRGGLFVNGWDAVVRREFLAQRYGRAAFGTDFRLMYRAIAELGSIPRGSRVLDVPTGSGVALRGIRREQALSYVAADVSPLMLGRAREEASRLGLEVELVEAHVEALPFDDGSFDACVSFMGLHCFPRPDLAIAEMGRVLRPGGELRGNTVVTGRWLTDRLISIWRRQGVFERVYDAGAVASWLAAAGLEDIEIERSGAIAYFSARRTA